MDLEWAWPFLPTFDHCPRRNAVGVDPFPVGNGKLIPFSITEPYVLIQRFTVQIQRFTSFLFQWLKELNSQAAKNVAFVSFTAKYNSYTASSVSYTISVAKGQWILLGKVLANVMCTPSENQALTWSIQVYWKSWWGQEMGKKTITRPHSLIKNYLSFAQFSSVVLYENTQWSDSPPQECQLDNGENTERFGKLVYLIILFLYRKPEFSAGTFN